MAIVRPGMSLLTVCENGFGKRTEIDEYRLQKRAGGGVINIRATERNGQVVALRAVTDADELMMITAGGIMLRMKVEQTRAIGRATQGVRMIRPDEGDKLVSVARIVSDDDDEEQDESVASGASAAAAADAQPTGAEAMDIDASAADSAAEPNDDDESSAGSDD
jgi:DNA gyrase subunit A